MFSLSVEDESGTSEVGKLDGRVVEDLGVEAGNFETRGVVEGGVVAIGVVEVGDLIG